MNCQEVERVHVNDCVRDEELEKMEAVEKAAAPGEWYLRADLAIERFDKSPVIDAASRLLMAKSRSYVPRLIRGIRTLENALRVAWAEAHSWKVTGIRERAQHVQDLARASGAKTSPEGEVQMLVRLRSRSLINDRQLESALRRWATGASVEPEFAYELGRLREGRA